MQLEIRDLAAIWFAETFYHYVANHQPVDDSVMSHPWGVAFSPDRHQLATASEDKTARVLTLSDDE